MKSRVLKAISIAFALLACVLFSMAALAATSSSNRNIEFVGSAGGEQCFARLNGTSVYGNGRDSISVMSDNEDSELFSVNESIGRFFVCGSKIVSYSRFAEDGKHYWFSYDTSTKKIKKKIIPTMDGVFWSDKKYIYCYTNSGSNYKTYRIELSTGRKTTLQTVVRHQPRGYIEGALICVDFRNNAATSWVNGKAKTLWKGTDKMRDVTVVGNKIFISQIDGLYQLVDGKAVRRIQGYAPILAQSGEYFVACKSLNQEDLTEKVRYYVCNSKSYAIVGDVDTVKNDIPTATAVWIEPDMNELLVWGTREDFALTLPSKNSMKAWK